MNNAEETVDILMSTYNGEKYLREQIDSILNQTYTNWKLIIRDDGSNDKTKAIIRDYIQQYPNKIKLIEDNRGNLGYKDSFYLLQFYSTSNYIMFADQDDFWHKYKIEFMLFEIKKREEKNSNKPCLICCDMEISNEHSSIIEPSYFKHVNIAPKQGAQSILLASQLHGCAFLFNKALLNFCNDLSDENQLLEKFETNGHDNFLSTVCAITGEIYYLNKPLVTHRIHDKNLVGFSRSNNKTLLLQLKIVLKYIFRNKDYRTLLYEKKMLENHQIISAIIKKDEKIVPNNFLFFLNINTSSYLERKWKNITSPFINHQNFIEKLVYILCF
jgi:glycosyltransferase involved in cell wall biosynthesis